MRSADLDLAAETSVPPTNSRHRLVRMLRTIRKRVDSELRVTSSILNGPLLTRTNAGLHVTDAHTRIRSLDKINEANQLCVRLLKANLDTDLSVERLHATSRVGVDRQCVCRPAVQVVGLVAEVVLNRLAIAVRLGGILPLACERFNESIHVLLGSVDARVVQVSGRHVECDAGE